jgi:hypothetical protein
VPTNRSSLAVTERYRAGMVALRRRGQTEARRIWADVSPENLDGTFPVGTLELMVSTLQREAARLSSAYLMSFLASELGHPTTPPPVTVWRRAWGGGDLRTGLRSAVIKAKVAIREGTDPREAVKNARVTLINDVGLFIDTAARESLRSGMEFDERIEGWQRVIKGTCGACAGDVAVEVSVNLPSVPLHVHPNCQCVTQPVITGLPNRFSPPSGADHFERLDRDGQDEMLGPEAAEKVRGGEATLADFVERDGGFISQKPAEDL